MNRHADPVPAKRPLDRPRRRRARLAGRLFAIGMIALLSSQPALASDNVRMKWVRVPANGYDHYIIWKFHKDFPENSAMRNYVSYGRNRWNEVDRELWFSWQQSSSDWLVRVKWSDLWWPNSGYLAIANVIANADGRVVEAEIIFNSAPDNGLQHWYGQTDWPSCSENYYDIYATAAHEFGHVVALDHSGVDADTMHSLLPCGSLEKRSLTTHDKDGIRALYPPH